MARAKGLTIRSYQPGDEGEIVRLFKEAYGSFTGPTKLTVPRWRQMHGRGWWNRPAVLQDPDCLRLLVGGAASFVLHDRRVREKLLSGRPCLPSRQAKLGRGRALGYLIFHQRTPKDAHAYIQEVCIAHVPDREELASLLIEEALQKLRARGVDSVTWMLSPADSLASGLADRFGFAKLLREPTVFMARVVSLESLLSELAGAFGRRLRGSDFESWSGSILFTLEEEQAALQVTRGRAKLAEKPPARPALTVRTGQETLCRMALGALRAEEAYQQDWLAVRPLALTVAGESRRALELLDVLFPENWWSLPRAHSW